MLLVALERVAGIRIAFEGCRGQSVDVHYAEERH